MAEARRAFVIALGWATGAPAAGCGGVGLWLKKFETEKKRAPFWLQTASFLFFGFLLLL